MKEKSAQAYLRVIAANFAPVQDESEVKWASNLRGHLGEESGRTRTKLREMLEKALLQLVFEVPDDGI
jgi:hypothetical protein